MSEVVLTTRYSPDNYPLALENLAKRYEKNGEPVHYTDAGFGEVSEDQASAALRFFADIELIENPKGANYVPPEPVITWMRKLGPIKEEAKQEVRELLMEYQVFNETVFVLQEGEQKLDSLSRQVGGLVGIDEDELADMKRTIQVFVELGFFEAGADGVIQLPEDVSSGDETKSSPSDSDDAASPDTDFDDDGSPDHADVGSNRGYEISGGLTIDVSISMDATEMEVNDLKEKLEVIEKSQDHDVE